MLAFAIMAELGGDLRGWLTAPLAAAGYRLDDDGAVRTAGGEPLAVAWSIAPADAYAARPWHGAGSPCPFVGRLAGHVVLAPAPGLPVGRGLARALMLIGRGVVARLDDDRAIAAVALATVAVEEAVAAAGLDRGARLLDRDPAGPYAADVLARIRAAVAGGGLRIGLTWRPVDVDVDVDAGAVAGERAARNPIELQRVQPFGSDQAYPAVWGKDGASFDPLRPLRGLAVELWLHDDAALDDASFWSPA